MPQTITVPPASPETITPPGGTFAFYVASNCNVCFGTATPPGSFPELENKTFAWAQGSTHSYPIPPNVGDSLPYNTSNPGVVCLPEGITENGKVIIVGSGMSAGQKPKKAAVKKPAAKKTVAKKTAAKKPTSRKAPTKKPAKRKAVPKKKAPAKKKVAKKKATVKKAAKKSGKKSRR